MATAQSAGDGSSRSGILKRYLPILQWLPQYQRSWLRADLIDGSTVWTVLIPIALAFAGIVGVDPVEVCIPSH